MNRDGHDDEDTGSHWRSPRPSEPTRIGLGVIEGQRARNGDAIDTTDRDVGNGPPTPRTPVDPRVLAGADTSVVLEHMNRAADQNKREHGDLYQVIDQLADKVDTCIVDIRELRDANRAVVAGLKVRDEALFALLPLPERTATLEGRVGEPSREERTPGGFKVIPATGLHAAVERLRAKQAGRDSNAVIVERLADTAVDGQRAEIERKRVVTAWVRQVGTWASVAGGGAGAVTFKAQPYVAIAISLVAVLLALLIAGAKKK
jgi:hypothetical protein